MALVTLTLTEHVELAATVPPTRLMSMSPATGANVPPQLLMIFGVAAITKLAGKVSVKAKPVRAIGLGLVIIKVSVDGLPTGTLIGKNDLAMVGVLTTFNTAVLLTTPAAPVCVEATPSEVLLYAPARLLVTSTLTVHEAFAVTVPPAKLMLTSVGAGAKVPPQVLTIFGFAATTKLAGKLSVNAKPLKAMPFGLVMVNVNVEAPSVGIVAGEKALLMVGVANMVNTAVLLTAPAAPVCVEDTPLVVLL